MAAKETKIYYSMGEVAEMMDVSTSLLRFWEQKFDILTPHKNKKGNRMFSPSDVRNLKTIYHLVKERGMTLAGADRYLKANRGSIERDMEIAERLGTIRALLLEVRNELGGGGVIVDDDAIEPLMGKSIEVIEEVEPVIGRPVEAEIETGTVAEEAVVAPVEVEQSVEKIADESIDVVEKPAAKESMAEERAVEESIKPLYIEQTLF